MALAYLVAVVHGVVIAFMLTGALVALAWPRVLLLHVPVTAAILGVYLAGADCPLTTLELALRASAGEEVYSGGFLGNYVLAPLSLDASDPAAQNGIRLVALLPNVVGYALLAGRAVRARPAGRLRGIAGG